MRVVQLKPVKVVYDDDVEPMTLMMAIDGTVPGQQREPGQVANASGRPTGTRGSKPAKSSWCPAAPTRAPEAADDVPAGLGQNHAIENDHYTLALIPERAKIVAGVFALASQGLGLLRVVQKLTADKTPAFGSMPSDEEIARVLFPPA